MIRDKVNLLSGELGEYGEKHNETLLLGNFCVLLIDGVIEVL